MIDSRDRGHITWDIETTGFGWSEEITVTGFWYLDSHATIIINAGLHTVEADALEAALIDASRTSVRVCVTEDEIGLLREMRQEVFERFDHDYNRLVAYNADSWKGGFDLPFIRTRCIQQSVDWMFDGVVFADLWEPVQKRLNTTHTAYGASSDVNTLTGAHAILFDRSECLTQILDEEEEHARYRESPYDPFEDSGSAVAHYQRGDLCPVAKHNLADIRCTWELGELVRQFVPAKNTNENKLWDNFVQNVIL